MWRRELKHCFEKLKDKIIKTTHLTKFDHQLPLILSTHAHAVGIVAVILHGYDDGTERPIAHESKTLINTQRKYSPVEREGHVVIFGVKRFQKFLYGRKSEQITDNKFLISLFNSSNKFLVLTSLRIQRWNMLLILYGYVIKYRGTHQHKNADSRSRLPIGHDVELNKNYSK